MTISENAKSVVISLLVIVIVIVVSFVVLPFDKISPVLLAADIDIVGGVPSYDQLKILLSVLSFPGESLNTFGRTLITTPPSESGVNIAL